MPLDTLYATVAAARRSWFERHPEARRQLRQPVFSVGNLSTGGTGKTPLVAQIAGWLVEQGERPAILSRGYGRRAPRDGAVVVSDGTSVLVTVDEAGDEPLMLARQVPTAIVCVCEDRHVAGVVAERALNATVHVLDDGFQHVRLARDFDILVTQPGEITHGHVLPRGHLRERRDAAARAHFVVMVDADVEVARTEAWELGVSAFSTARRQLGLSPWPERAWAGPPHPSALLGMADTDVAPVIAVAGIGKPGQFFALLHDAGWRVAETLTFADHHRYSATDVERIKRALAAANATSVVTTAKDAVRFEALGKLPFELSVMPMQLELDNWRGLASSLSEVLERARARA